MRDTSCNSSSLTGLIPFDNYGWPLRSETNLEKRPHVFASLDAEVFVKLLRMSDTLVLRLSGGCQ